MVNSGLCVWPGALKVLSPRYKTAAVEGESHVIQWCAGAMGSYTVRKESPGALLTQDQ